MDADSHALLVASNNRGKVREYATLLASLPVQITWPHREGIEGFPEETGTTFKENALLKARHFAQGHTYHVLADDSGLEVDALRGAPGVYSARFAGAEASDADRNRLLLEQLRGVAWQHRTARFQCVIALVRPDGSETTFCGTREGYISFECRGGNGFGYDPVFFVPQMGRTFGELETATKNCWSHRAEATRKLVQALAAELGTGQPPSPDPSAPERPYVIQ